MLVNFLTPYPNQNPPIAQARPRNLIAKTQADSMDFARNDSFKHRSISFKGNDIDWEKIFKNTINNSYGLATSQELKQMGYKIKNTTPEAISKMVGFASPWDVSELVGVDPYGEVIDVADEEPSLRFLLHDFGKDNTNVGIAYKAFNDINLRFVKKLPDKFAAINKLRVTPLPSMIPVVGLISVAAEKAATLFHVKYNPDKIKYQIMPSELSKQLNEVFYANAQIRSEFYEKLIKPMHSNFVKKVNNIITVVPQIAEQMKKYKESEAIVFKKISDNMSKVSDYSSKNINSVYNKYVKNLDKRFLIKLLRASLANVS